MQRRDGDGGHVIFMTKQATTRATDRKEWLEY